MEFTLGAFQSPTNVPTVMVRAASGLSLMVSHRVLRSTDITQTEREFLRQNLSPSVRAEPFEACLSEVVGVNWVDGPFGCGDLAVSCNRCVVFSELFVNTAETEPYRAF